MKKYTYTNMRTELSDVLDILRSGESVTITQRGKPDVVLQGLSASQVNDNLHNEDELVIETSKTSKRTPITSPVQSWADLPPFLEETIKLM